MCWWSKAGHMGWNKGNEGDDDEGEKDIKMQKPSVGCVEIVPDHGEAGSLEALFDGSK